MIVFLRNFEFILRFLCICFIVPGLLYSLRIVDENFTLGHVRCLEVRMLFIFTAKKILYISKWNK